MAYSEPYVIGIDIGTGSVKAVALNGKGELLNTVQTFYDRKAIQQDEINVLAVFDSFLKCLRHMLKMQPSSLRAVVLSSAMHSLLAVGKNGQPLTNAMLWSDTRSAAIAEALRGTEQGRAFYRATGTPVHAMSPLCKLRWLQQAEPTIFQHAEKFVSIKEFIWKQLFDEYCIDHSIASATGLFNTASLQWDENALRFATISANRLSTIVSVDYCRSDIKSSFKKRLRINGEVPFYIGASDGCLANLGSLCLEAASASITIGTSAAVRVTSPIPIVDEERMIFSYRLNALTFVCGGATNNGGNLITWLVQHFSTTSSEAKNFEALFHQMETVPAGSEGLLFLPYIHGERAPVWDEHSCGVYFGVKPHHNKACFIRAAIEGLCFALYDILSSIEKRSVPVERIVLSGGVAAAKPFVQLLANVTGKPVITFSSGDASAVGAAYLGLKAEKLIEDYLSLQASKVSTVLPDQTSHSIYQKLFPVFKTLYPSLKQAMHLLHQHQPR